MTIQIEDNTYRAHDSFAHSFIYLNLLYWLPINFNFLY